MTILDKPFIKKIDKKVTHQNIGGKEIYIERELNFNEILDLGTIAAFQFIERRIDIFQKGILTQDDINNIQNGKYTLDDFNKMKDEEFKQIKVYYGHVGNLGYFVCEDELMD